MQTHSFDLFIAPHYFPAIKVVKPFYATVRYQVRGNEIYHLSLEFNSLALSHITGVAAIAEEAREAAKQNAIKEGFITGSLSVPIESDHNPDDLKDIL